MPRVPIFQPQAKLTTEGPSVLVDSQSYGKGNLALAQLWQGSAQAGEKLADVGLQLQRHLTDQEDAQDYAKRLFSFNRNLREFADGVKQIENPNDWLGAFQNDAKTSLEGHLEGASERVAQHLNLHAAKTIPSMEAKVRQEAQAFRISRLQGDLPGQLEAAAQEVINAPDEMSAASLKGTFLGTLRAASHPEYGYLTPKQAAEWEGKFDQAVKVGRYKQSLLQNPPGTLEALRQPGAFGFDDTQRGQAIRETTAEMHRVQQETGDKLYQAFVAKQIGPAALKQQADALLQGGQLGRQYHTLFTGIYESEAAGIKAATDYDGYWPMLQAAQAGTLDMNKAIEARKAGRLTDANMNTLMSSQIRGAQGEPPTGMEFLKDPALKMSWSMALREIQNRLRPLDENMFAKMSKKAGMGGVREDASYEARAAISFTNAVQAQAKTGELTGDWMLQKAVEISKPFQAAGMGGLLRAPRGPMGPAGGPTTTGGRPSNPRVLNKKTGQMEEVTPEEFNQILKYQGGGQ